MQKGLVFLHKKWKKDIIKPDKSKISSHGT